MKPLILFCIVTLGTSVCEPAQEALKAVGDRAKPPVTVPDVIRMTMLGHPLYWLGVSSRGLVAQFSPDGKQFVVVVRKGNLEQNTNEYSLLLWRTEELSRSPVPAALLRMSSSSNRPAIFDVQWLPDSETIAFLGENPGEQAQLYRFNVKTRALRSITNSPYSLVAYSTTPNCDEVAYFAEGPADTLFDQKNQREGLHVSTQPLYKLLVGQKGADWEQEKILFFQSANGVAHRLNPTDKLDYRHLSLSPDGKYIQVLSYVADLPESWKGYSDRNIQRLVSTRGRAGYTPLRRYSLIETGTGKSRVLLNAPQTSFTETAWSPDGHSVAISSARLPLDRITVNDLRTRQSSTFAVEVEVPSGEIRPISDEDVKLLAWDAKTNQLVFEAGRQSSKRGPGPKVFFRKVGDKWEKVSDVNSEQSCPDVVLEEDMNTPPNIVAIDSSTQRRTVLLDLNPHFRELRFGKVEEITWKTPNGINVKAGLYYPVDYVPGKRYPLVIQTHGWTPDRFWIEGPLTTAFAAQPLAGKGIMVLQVDESIADLNTAKEVGGRVAAYESAIEHLDEKGLIDRTRVGIIGLSRTCMYVKYALTHSKYRFAAASVTDGVDAGYFQYISNVTNNPGYTSEMERVNDGLPFGDGLRSWMIRSPGFNVDKVNTPIRIVAENPSVALFEWEWFAALSRLGKPVDMVMMQNGEHLLQKPWERMVSQQGNVDWFCFWLKGEQDPDPAKAEQYARWGKLRKQAKADEENSTDKFKASNHQR